MLRSARTDLLLLDEPTSGLDPLMEEQFQECVLAEKARGTTVLLSSHILSEVERLCDRATIIRQGQTVASGTITSLSSGTSSVLSAITRHEPLGLDAIDGVTDLVISRIDAGTKVDARVRKESMGAVTEQLTLAGTVSLTVTPPSLHELFLDLYKTNDDSTIVKRDADAEISPSPWFSGVTMTGTWRTLLISLRTSWALIVVPPLLWALLAWLMAGSISGTYDSQEHDSTVRIIRWHSPGH